MKENQPKNKKETRGGKRPFSGRKKGEPKKAIGIRVRVRFYSKLVQMVKVEEQRLLELERQNGL